MSIKITPEELKTLLKSKKCSTPLPRFLAINLFNDLDHPLSELPHEEFRLRDIFNYIQIINDPTKD